jgi:AcrR family transcriptional regulator
LTSRLPLKERIQDAADVLLGRFGFQRTTMDDLAREARVGRRTIYMHFSSKEEVFLASIDRVVERLLDELMRIAASPQSSAQRLRAMLLARVLFRFDSVRDYYQSLEEMLSLLRARYLERRERYFAAEADVLASVLAEGARKGEFVFDDSRATARALVLATNSLIPYSLTTRELGSREEIECNAGRIADLTLNGLLPRRTALE